MRNRIIMYSGGKASFAVADYVKERHPEDNIVLHFTDTEWEDVDLYRFLYEGADKLQLPLHKLSKGLDPMQLMFEKRVVFNSRIGLCSIELKAKTSSDYIREGIEPPISEWYNKEFLKDEDYTKDAVLYYGIDWTEAHREKGIKRNWEDYDVEMPLIDNHIDTDEVLAKYNIKQPRLYDFGFQHNNCLGRCVKAGIGHFKNLYEKMPKVFRDTADREHHIATFADLWLGIKRDESLNEDERKELQEELDACYRDYFYYRADAPKPFVKHDGEGKTYAFMRKQKDGVRFAYPILELEKELASNEQLSLDDALDIGGCGCGVDLREEMPKINKELKDFE